MPFVIAVIILLVILVFSALNVLNEYERAVVFTLGRFTGIKGPGLVLIYPVVQRMRKVDLRVIVLRVDAAGFHAHKGRALAGHRVDVKHLQLGARSNIEPYAVGSTASRRRRGAADTAPDRCPGGCGGYRRRHPLQQRHQTV